MSTIYVLSGGTDNGMGENLAKELRKYYSREGNKVVFRSGMSLNELAFEMNARLWHQTGQGYDSSVLSKIINNREGRLFSPTQLEVFCEVVGLTNKERERLQHALNRDVVARYGVEMDLSVFPGLIDLLLDYPEKIEQLWIQSNPEIALTWASDIATRLKKFLRDVPPSNSSEKLLKMLGRILHEQATLERHRADPPDVLKVTEPYAAEIREIARECQDEEILGLAHASLADAYYITKRYGLAAQWTAKALPLIANDDTKLSTLRMQALNWAYLDQDKEFEKMDRETRRLIEAGRFSNLERVCGSLEGLARAEGQLGRPSAYRTLEEAEEIYEEMGGEKAGARYRAVQLARTKIEVAHNLGETDEGFIEDVGSHGLRLAREHGYKKHERLIRKLLEESLD